MPSGSRLKVCSYNGVFSAMSPRGLQYKMAGGGFAKLPTSKLHARICIFKSKFVGFVSGSMPRLLHATFSLSFTDKFCKALFKQRQQ